MERTRRGLAGRVRVRHQARAPINELTVWTRGETAWFTMELDYIRYIGQGSNQRRSILPLRETGVLERRNGNWILVAWHESSRKPAVGRIGPRAE